MDRPLHQKNGTPAHNSKSILHNRSASTYDVSVNGRETRGQATNGKVRDGSRVTDNVESLSPVKTNRIPSTQGAPNGAKRMSGTGGYDSEDDAEYRSGDEEAAPLVQNEPPKLRKISQKKKVEQANFSKWLSSNRQSLSKKAAKRSTGREESLQYMVRSWEGGEKIINSPRDYQLELFERAKNNNTIAVLDTGQSFYFCQC